MRQNQDAGIMAQLFTGNFDRGLLFPYPTMSADDREMVDLVLNSFKEFARRHIDPAALDERHEQPESLVEGLFDLGLMGMTIPEEYGGSGMGMTPYCRIMEDVGRCDPSVAVTIGAHQSIGMKALLLFGTEDQKKRYLPDLADGKRIAAFALTEPDAGSDAAAIATRAAYDSERDLYTLNGSKLWITNGGISGLISVFAKEEIEGTDVISAFLVEGEAKGLKRGKPEAKMGIRSSNTAALFLEDVEVRGENVLGERGKGFKMAMEVLNYGRLSLAAGCVGGMKELLEMVIDHASQREQFGTRICDLEMIRRKISDIAVEAWAAESMVYLTTSLVDQGVEDFSIESAICKAYSSEALLRVVNEGMQAVGGISYMSEYPFERMYRDCRINTIFEGTNEIQRLYIALAGLKRPGRLLRDMQKKGKVTSLVEYGAHYFRKRLTSDRLEGVHPSLSPLRERIEEWTKQFSLAVENLLVAHGKKIVRMGYLQERVADAAIHLYGMAAVLSRLDTLIKDRGIEACGYESNLTKAYFGRAWRAVRKNLKLLDGGVDHTITAIAEETVERRGYTI